MESTSAMASSSTSSNRSTPGGLDLGLLGRLLLQQGLLLVPQAAGLLEALRLDGVLLLLLDVGDAVLELLQVGRGLHALDAQAGAGLVDEVDGLVGEVAVRDVALGQVGRGHEGLIGDGDPVVRLVAVPQALQDLDGVGHGGLFDLDRLEAALQGGVLLQVLAVLVQRGGADGLQLTPGQHRLEDRRRVDGALGRPGTDEGVDLVDEEDDVATGADLLEDLLEALLEVAPVAGAGDQCAEVQRVELLGVERLGDIAHDDLLGQAFDDRGLADARLSDQDRVVLGAAGQHLHDPLHLPEAADDRVELLVPGQGGEVAAELVQHRGAGLAGLLLRAAAAPGSGAGRLLAALGALVTGEEVDDGLADAGQVRTELHEHLGGDALALPDEAEEDVLRPDVVVPELESLSQGQLQHLLGPGRERDVPRRRRAPRPMISSTWPRTASNEMPSDSSAFAATPSPSWMRPSRTCSVPM